ncbi:hypothetical protein LCGC14_1210220 [marine sediment metagenome]|uniref:Uncharacterized protein n=1 Tax=marine sediment metagenome TaxID=412755 RepID=A0A0F9LE45_9ZZZZ
MLEVRYITATGEVTGWCGDKNQFGNLDRERVAEAIIVFDIPVPPLSLDACLVQGSKLIDNPSYIEPPPPRDLLVEVDELKARLDSLGVK